MHQITRCNFSTFFATCLLGGLGLLTFELHSQFNDFPLSWHPDERGKAAQILSGQYNFFHPQLLLSATKAWAWMQNTPSQAEDIVVAGRTVSSLFSALSVILAGCLGWMISGRWAGFVVALTTSTIPAVFDASNTMKEDSALLLGSLSFLCASGLILRGTDWWRFALLGAGAGLALSGKYIGLLTIPVAAAAILATTRKVASPIFFAVAGALLIFPCLNGPALNDPLGLRDGFAFELRHVLTDHQGTVAPILSSMLPIAILKYSFVPMIGLALGLLAGVGAIKNPVSVFTLLLATLFVLAFQVSSIKAYRYILLPVVLINVIGVTCLVQVAASARVLRYTAGALLAIWQGVLVFWLIQDINSIRLSSRREAAQWIDAHLPADKTIAEHWLVGIPEKRDQSRFVRLSDDVDLADLRKQGVSYVIVSSLTYGWILDESLVHSIGSANYGTFRRRRAFYEALFRDARLVAMWSNLGSAAATFSPELKLYAVE